MSDYMEKAPHILEDAYLAIVSNTEINVSAEKAADNAERIHCLTLKMLKLDTADMSVLNAAFEVEGVKMEQALKTLEGIITENPGHVQMLHVVDQAFLMMNSFFTLLY